MKNYISFHQGHDANIAFNWNGKYYAIQAEKVGGKRYQAMATHKPFIWENLVKEIDKIVGDGKFDVLIRPVSSYSYKTKGGRAGARVLDEIKWKYLKEDGLVIQSCLHHMAHAYTALYCSPYDEALVVTIDGGGDGEYFTINHGTKKNGIEQLETIDMNLGGWYNAMSRLVGEIDENAMGISLPGKAMGVVARGTVDIDRAQIIKHLQENDILFRASQFAGSKSGVLQNWMSLPQRHRENLNKLFNNKKYDYFYGQEAYDHMADVQWAFENTVFEKIDPWMQKYPDLPLVLAGGCALNVLNNEVLKNYYHPRGIYIPACPADEGLGLGYVLEKTRPNKQVRSHDICPPLRDTDDFSSIYRSKGKKVTNKTICKLLSEGKIIGYVQGNSEYGPRALGFRSIICDPYFEDMRDKINVIKHREWWRPFAPACRKEDADKYFDSANFDNLEYMSFAPMVKEDKRDEVAAIVHVDGSSRLQTVTKDSNPKFYKLLSDWEKYHDKHVLLNTSFNIKGRAILNTLDEAFEVLQTEEMDYLCIENVLYDKKDFV